jgi:hypothetical protein
MHFLKRIWSFFARGLATNEELINKFSTGVVDAYKVSFSTQERRNALLALAQQDWLLSAKLSSGVPVRIDHSEQLEMKLSGDKAIVIPASVGLEQQVDVILREIGFIILAKVGESQFSHAMLSRLSADDRRRLDESNHRTRSSLDWSSVDSPKLMLALRHTSDAKLRLGFSYEDLSNLELQARGMQNLLIAIELSLGIHPVGIYP